NSSDSNVSVLLGDGSGAFSPAAGSPVSVGTAPISVAVVDFNGDGKQDLATANRDSNNVSVLLGDGSGAFSPASRSPLSVRRYPLSVAVGDFNGDGNLDIAVANAGSKNVSVLLGYGTGAFRAASPLSVGRSPISVVVGDFNQDGKPDIAVANNDSANVSVLLG